MTGTELASQLESGPHDRAARHPDEQSFLAREAPCVRERGLLPGLHHAVDDRAVEVLRNESRSHALELMLPAFSAGEHRGPRRFDRDDERVSVLLLQKSADAADRTACTGAVDESV